MFSVCHRSRLRLERDTITLRDQVRHLQKEVGVVRRLFAPKAQESAQARHRHQVQQNYRYLMANYRPTQSFVGNLALISSQQVLAGPSAAAWQSVTTGRVEVYAVPGVHQTYLGQYVNDTADCLRTCLGNAQTGASIAEDTPFSLSAV